VHTHTPTRHMCQPCNLVHIGKSAPWVVGRDTLLDTPDMRDQSARVNFRASCHAMQPPWHPVSLPVSQKGSLRAHAGAPARMGEPASRRAPDHCARVGFCTGRLSDARSAASPGTSSASGAGRGRRSARSAAGCSYSVCRYRVSAGWPRRNSGVNAWRAPRGQGVRARRAGRLAWPPGAAAWAGSRGVPCGSLQKTLHACSSTGRLLFTRCRMSHACSAVAAACAVDASMRRCVWKARRIPSSRVPPSSSPPAGPCLLTAALQRNPATHGAMCRSSAATRRCAQQFLAVMLPDAYLAALAATSGGSRCAPRSMTAQRRRPPPRRPG